MILDLKLSDPSALAIEKCKRRNHQSEVDAFDRPRVLGSS